jgi:hypothetical protein
MTWGQLSDELVAKPGWHLENEPRPCWCLGPAPAPRLRIIEEADGYVVRDAEGTRHEFGTLGQLLAWINVHGTDGGPGD